MKLTSTTQFRTFLFISTIVILITIYLSASFLITGSLRTAPVQILPTTKQDHTESGTDLALIPATGDDKVIEPGIVKGSHDEVVDEHGQSIHSIATPVVSATLTTPSAFSETATVIEPAPFSIQTINPTVPGEEVAICVVAKGVHRDLPEFFIHHYHHLQIRRFYIIDQHSFPALSAIEDLGIPPSAVTFITEPPSTETNPDKSQLAGYNLCHSRYGHLHQWIAHLDADEFLEITPSNDTAVKTPTLIELLDTYTHPTHLSAPLVGALAVNLLTHTSNNHTYRPASTARKAYTACLPDYSPVSASNSTLIPSPENKHVKSIVRTAYFDHAVTDHSFATNSSSITVGENWDQVKWIFRVPITRNKITVHHYPTKSFEEFKEKLATGYVEEPKAYPDMEVYWNHLEELKTEECLEMTNYHP